MRITRTNTNRSAVNQWIGRVARMVEHCAVHSRQTQFVAVILYAVHNPLANAFRVKYTCLQIFPIHVGGTKTQHVRAGNRTMRHAQHVAYDPADAGVGAAEGLDRRGMIVRLDLEGKVIFVVEFDHTGVVHERGSHPGRVDFLRRSHQVRPQDRKDHVREMLGTGLTIEARLVLAVDLRSKRLMHTVFRPGLRQGLEFAVRRRSILGGEIGLNRFQFFHVQCQTPFEVHRLQLVFIHPNQIDVRRGDDFALLNDELGLHLADGVALDDVVEEKGLGDLLHFSVGQFSFEFVALSCGDRFHASILETMDGAQELVGHVVRHTGQETDLDHAYVTFYGPSGPDRVRIGQGEVVLLCDRVANQPFGDFPGSFIRETTFQEIKITNSDGHGLVDSDRGELGR